MISERSDKTAWLFQPINDGCIWLFGRWNLFISFIRRHIFKFRKRVPNWDVRYANDNAFKKKIGKALSGITNLLALCAVILYPTSFWICEFFYPGDPAPKEWFVLRDLHRGIVVTALVLMNYLPRTKIRKAAMTAMLVFCVGNLIDRLVFGITTYVVYDAFVWFWAVYIFIMKIRANDTGQF